MRRSIIGIKLAIVAGLLSLACAPVQVLAQVESGPVPVDVSQLAPNGNYYALIIGINDYSRPLPKLATAVADAKSVAQVLHDSYGFQVKLLLDQDATRSNILTAIAKYRNKLNENDNLLIYYAGHGISDPRAEKAYWIPVDSDSIDSPNRISADDITTGIKVQSARHVLIISDSCYSGGLTRGIDAPMQSAGQIAFLNRMLKSTSRTLMASGGDEPVSDGGTDGHSVFAYALLRSLQRMDFSVFTASDLFYGSVRQQVAGRSSQLPEYSIIRNSSHDDGDFVFVRAAVPKPIRTPGVAEAVQPPVKDRAQPSAVPNYVPPSTASERSQPSVTLNRAQPPPAPDHVEPSIAVSRAQPTAALSTSTITGAGAVFPYSIYSRWFAEFNQVNPGVKINYQSIGSGGGIRQVSEGTVDFGATDGPMSDEQISSAKVKTIHIPTVLGAVVPVYNLPEVNADLNFSANVLADIYLGKIAKWNDPRIAHDNPGVNFPDKAILPVYRSDGSGTTYIFTDFLSKVSPDFQSKVGKGTSVKWPTGIGQKGNEGVAGLVRQSPYSFGYVELIYAAQNNTHFGAVKNASGNFIRASTDSVTAAASAVANTMPYDNRVSITDAPGPDSYPISSFTWLLIPVESKDPARGKALQAFLQWMLDHGEAEAAGMNYAPLPQQVLNKVRGTIKSIH